jgi:hypothetical protein
VLPRNAGAIWRGRRCQTGQVIAIDPGQENGVADKKDCAQALSLLQPFHV